MRCLLTLSAFAISLGTGTERSVIEEDNVVKCVFERFVVGPDFAHGRLFRNSI